MNVIFWNEVNIPLVYILFISCMSNLWEFKGHVKFAEINAVVSNFGILRDQKAETRGGSVTMVSFHWPVAGRCLSILGSFLVKVHF